MNPVDKTTNYTMSEDTYNFVLHFGRHEFDYSVIRHVFIDVCVESMTKIISVLRVGYEFLI